MEPTWQQLAGVSIPIVPQFFWILFIILSTNETITCVSLQLLILYYIFYLFFYVAFLLPFHFTSKSIDGELCGFFFPFLFFKLLSRLAK